MSESVSTSRSSADIARPESGTPSFRPWEEARPRAVERAVGVALAQILLALIALVVALQDTFDLAYTLYEAGVLSYDDEGGAVAVLVAAFLVGNLPWLWLASRMGRGRNWARVTMTVFNALVAVNLLVALPSGDLMTIVFALANTVLAVAGTVLMYAEGTERWFRRD